MDLGRAHDAITDRARNFAPSDLELQILTALAAGRTCDEVADHEHLSRRTLGRMIQRLKDQTGCGNLTALCAHAVAAGWIRVERA